MDAALLDALPMAVGQLDPRGRLVIVNAAWRRLTESCGHPDGGAALGADYPHWCDRAATHGDVAGAALATAVREVLTGSAGSLSLEYCWACGDGPRWLRADLQRLPGGGAVIVHTDVTRQRRALDAAEAAARRDPLTGLLNRAAFHEELCARLTRGGAEPAALVMIDLDHFKDVNDIHGHAAGDRVLTVLARRLRHAVRPHDTVARMGGDEFLVLIDRLPDEAAFAALIDRLRCLLEQPIALDDRTVTLGASIGAVLLDGAMDDAELVVREADRRMYDDKRRRRRALGFRDAVLGSAVA